MLYALVISFMLLDFGTGIIMAVKNHNFNSSKMRDGLFNKMALIVLMAVGVLIDYGQTIVDLGMSAPVAEGVCVYIILMEFSSILENVALINPDLLPEKLSGIFQKVNKKKSKEENKHER